MIISSSQQPPRFLQGLDYQTFRQTNPCLIWRRELSILRKTLTRKPLETHVRRGRFECNAKGYFYLRVRDLHGFQFSSLRKIGRCSQEIMHQNMGRLTKSLVAVELGRPIRRVLIIKWVKLRGLNQLSHSFNITFKYVYF